MARGDLPGEERELTGPPLPSGRGRRGRAMAGGSAMECCMFRVSGSPGATGMSVQELSSTGHAYNV